MSKHFEIIRSLHEEFYQTCVLMEKNAKTNPTTAAFQMRRSLEYFLKWFLQYNKLSYTDETGRPLTPEKMIQRGFEANKLLRHQSSTLHQIRRYTNPYAHTPDLDKVAEPARIHDVLKYMKQFHSLVIGYLRYRRIIKQSFELNEDLVMINDFQPIRLIDINEYEEGCTKKYYCKQVDPNTQMVTYHVIREFMRDNQQEASAQEFLTRDLLALEQRWQDRRHIPQHIVRHQKIELELNNKLFFTCYELSDVDKNLTEINIGTLSLQDRLTLIEGTAKGIRELHGGKTPMYHRALTPSSIYVQYEDGELFDVKIGNFEYTKLPDGTAVTMKSKVINRNKDPFRAPELDKKMDLDDWSKADIYSLGMLILYFFGFQGYEAIFQVEELSQVGFSDDFIDLVAQMTNQSYEFRPTITEVTDVINREVKQFV
nr:hypothetical protein [Fredinandcohnia onubensis]